MKKRLRKKVGKYKCLKCSRSDGIIEHYMLKTGRMISGRLQCFVCDLGFDHEYEDLWYAPVGITRGTIKVKDNE